MKKAMLKLLGQYQEGWRPQHITRERANSKMKFEGEVNDVHDQGAIKTKGNKPEKANSGTIFCRRKDKDNTSRNAKVCI